MTNLNKFLPNFLRKKKEMTKLKLLVYVEIKNRNLKKQNKLINTLHFFLLFFSPGRKVKMCTTAGPKP